MKPVTTLSEAQNLPERSLYAEHGFNELVAVDLSDDAILMFQDLDGRMMNVQYDSQGAYKCES